MLVPQTSDWAENLARIIIDEVTTLPQRDSKELLMLHLRRVHQEGRVEGLQTAIETLTGGKP